MPSAGDVFHFDVLQVDAIGGVDEPANDDGEKGDQNGEEVIERHFFCNGCDGVHFGCRTCDCGLMSIKK